MRLSYRIYFFLSTVIGYVDSDYAGDVDLQNTFLLLYENRLISELMRQYINGFKIFGCIEKHFIMRKNHTK